MYPERDANAQAPASDPQTRTGVRRGTVKRWRERTGEPDGERERARGNGGTEPLRDADGSVECVAISFADVTRYRALEEELDRTRAELATAYRELHATVDVLEATNEELQSTNRELETTKEELRSTNRELEATNEELRSTNQELETMNDEFRARTDDAVHATAFLRSILQSIEQGVIVLDAELRVTAWSSAAADLWGLRADEVERRRLVDLDIGLPAADLVDRIFDALDGETGKPIELVARDRRGQRVRCSIDLSQLRNAGGEANGVILVTRAEPLPEER